MAPWFEVLAHNRFLNAPSELLRCVTCGYTSHILTGTSPAGACPACSRHGSIVWRPGPLDCTPELVDATIPDGAIAAGVARVG